MWIDTHCHLDAAEFDVDREAVSEAARQANVSVIVVPAVERANFGAVASICREQPGCVAAFGIHPMVVARAREEDIHALRETIAREQPVAVGEIGLDRFVAERDDAQQLYYFVEQLKIAQEAELPVLLHVRRAIDQVLQQLRRVKLSGDIGGIAHAFNGSQQQAEEFIKLGFKLGFGGAMTFPRAHRIRKLAATLPVESIVLETDAPDMPPEWKVGARNTPDQLPRIAQTLALLRGVPLSVIAEATTANAVAVLPGLARLV
ncbi:DNAase [Rugosibacter aromaticivorans]|uniref:DNAase n=1 Tax=Rugosibacter aromaticivorans TaxID=1565605 RepID=A0A0C5JK41_9PROT|nr:TatD family hydrolase [Rugosibacter aromaticivorans]AJP47731.1 DNAase [Rugosibacter aromaticivorans]TBR13162.1 MAG: TatD family deoxyribonuclease [Rugosibacter sp.]